MAKKRGPCRKLFQAPLWGCHFFILSPALLWGDFLFLSLSLSVSPFLFFPFFYFILWCSPFFFVVAVVSSGAVALFYHAKFAEPGLRRSHQPRLHLGSVFSLRFDYPLSLLLPHSHPFPLTSSPHPKTNFTHQVCLSSPPQPPSFLHLSPFDQEPACSFLLLPFALFCVYSAIFPPLQPVKNTVRAWSLWCSRALESMAWLFLLISLRPSDLVFVSVSQMTSTPSQLDLKMQLASESDVRPRCRFQKHSLNDVCPRRTTEEMLNIFNHPQRADVF